MCSVDTIKKVECISNGRLSKRGILSVLINMGYNMMGNRDLSKCLNRIDSILQLVYKARCFE